MRSVRAIGSFSLLALLLSLSSVPPAAAASMWTSPETLGNQGNDAVMDVNADGDAVAAWTSERGVKASFRPAGRDWQHPSVLSSAAGDLAGVFLTDAGRATALWSDGETLMVADRASDGSWKLDGRAPSMASSAPWISSPTAAADADGNLHVTWNEADDLRPDGYVSWWRSAGGRWTSGGPGGGRGSWGRDLVVNDGVATLALGRDGVYTQTGRVGERALVYDKIWPGIEVSAPSLAVNRRGDMVLAALDGEDPNAVMNAGDPGRLIVITRPAGEAWRPGFIADTAGLALNPSVAIGDGGRIGVTYQRASDSALEVRVGDVRGVDEGMPTTLATQGTRTGKASIAFDSTGTAVATWSSKGPDSRHVPYAAVRPAGGSWGAPARIGDLATSPTAVYSYPNGMFTSLFFDGAARWTDYVDDILGPRTVMRAPGREFTTGTSVSVRWDATDDLSRPGSSDVRVRSAGRTGGFGAWTMWKRRTEETSGSFGGKPGRTYCFSARGRDRVGNLGGWSAERCASTPIDDRAFTASGGWSRLRQQSAYLGTLTTSDTSRSRLRLDSVRASSLRLVVRACPACGTVRVTHGGRNLGEFDLTSRRQRKLVIVLSSYSAPVAGAVIVQVVGGGKPVQIDGLVSTP